MSRTRLRTREVMATTMTSGFPWLNVSDETTRAGRILVVVKSVNGKATRTTSPRLKAVINGVLEVVPKAEGFFSGSQSRHIVARKMNQGRQIPQEFPLFLRLQRFYGSFNHFQSHAINIADLSTRSNVEIIQRVANAALGGVCVSP
jgi:hypothetical protein